MKRADRPTRLDALELPELGGTLEFMRVLWSIDHALQRKSKHMARSLGVTGPQRLVIRIVGRFPGITAGRLAALLHVHPSTLTGILKRLEHKRLIRRRASPRDARRLELGLTAAGRRLDGAMEGTVEGAVERAIGRVPARDLASARSLLASIAESLELEPAARRV